MAVDSAQYRVTPHSIILQGTWLRTVSYCGKLDSAQYNTAHTARCQSWKNRVTWRNFYKNWKYFYPLLSGQGRLELWKKTGSKSRLTPLKNSISRQKRNKKWKYFNPLVSGPGQFEWWKKLGVENLVGLSR